MRALVEIAAADVPAVLAALRGALTGDGPAILPRSEATSGVEAPAEVRLPTAVVLETSGSSGTPKLVALSANALLASAAATESALGGPGAWVLALPVHYIAGLQVLVRSLASGIEPVLLDEGTFDPAAFAAAGRRLPSNSRRYSSLVPAQLLRLLDAAEADSDAASNLRAFDALLIGGQRLPEPLRERAAALGIRIVATYGATETCGGCVYDGTPIGGCAIRIVDGQVEISGPMLAEGYLSADAQSSVDDAFVSAGGERWYRTRDAGFFDGRLTVTGRVDDVIVSGGEKVSLGSVEAAVRRQPGLSGAVVVRASSERWGEVPVVVAERPEQPHEQPATPPPALSALRRLLSAELGRAAAPERLVLVDVLPTLPSGKPDRMAIAILAAHAESFGGTDADS